MCEEGTLVVTRIDKRTLWKGGDRKVRHLKILSRLGVHMYLYENEIFRVSVRNSTEQVPDSFQLAVPKPVPYLNSFTPT